MQKQFDIINQGHDDTDEFLLSRQHHTGQQPASSISDMNSAVDTEMATHQQAAIANASGTCDVDALTNSPTDALTNYGAIAAILGADVNSSNTKQNTISTNLNALAGKYNVTAGVVNNLEAKVNTLLTELRAYGVIVT